MFNKFLQPSGLNSSFFGGNASFIDYVEKIQHMIATARLDLTPTNAEKLIEANSPFEFLPELNANNDIGILLIHGLYDSPFTLREIGAHLAQQGFLVRSVLLPGHGTVPGDLLKIHAAEWIKAVNFGVQSLMSTTKEIYLLGFSLGGTLALYEACKNPAIKALVLIAPAIKTIKKYASLARCHCLMSWLYKPWQWYRVRPQKSYARYESYPCQAAAESYHLIKQTYKAIKKKKFNIPIFMMLSTDDETVCAPTAINFFKQQPNNNNRLIIYTNRSTDYQDKRISVRKSAIPSERILNYSHPCLPIAPDNPHFGKHGDYQDFSYYSDISQLKPPIFLGAASHQNLKRHTIQRLSYNPDYYWMTQQLDEFLSTLLNKKETPDSF